MYDALILGPGELSIDVPQRQPKAVVRIYEVHPSTRRRVSHLCS